MPSDLKAGRELRRRLARRVSKQGLAQDAQGPQHAIVKELFGRRATLDEAFYEELETALLRADVGVAATAALIRRLRARARREGYTDAAQLRSAARGAARAVEADRRAARGRPHHQPFVIMLAGVNGAGKTTSIGKLAHYYQQQGKSVLLAAGDTFRAAAREQLAAWGERNNVAVIAQQSGDAAAVIFDAINAAQARGIDIVLLADTAGRLPTQLHLMEEIKKVKRVIAKALPGAPHEVLLVLDANTGQNALTQVKAFDDALGVTGSCSPSSTAPRKAGSSPPSRTCAPARGTSRYRCASSASAKGSTTCSRSTRRSSSTPCCGR